MNSLSEQAPEPPQHPTATESAVQMWIPDQCGITDNKQTNVQAKESAREEHHDNGVCPGEKKTIIRALTTPKAERIIEGLLSAGPGAASSSGEALHRTHQTDSHIQTDSQENQTTEHVLQRCPLHKTARNEMCDLFALRRQPNSSAVSRALRRRLHKLSPELLFSCGGERQEDDGDDDQINCREETRLNLHTEQLQNSWFVCVLVA